MGRELVSIVPKLVKVVVNGELGIIISNKWAANFTSFNICEAISARSVATARNILVAPLLETFEKYEGMAGDLLALIESSTGEAAVISFKAIETFCGLHGCKCQFMSDGNAVRNLISFFSSLKMWPPKTNV